LALRSVGLLVQFWAKSLKDFGFEQLPFKRFAANSAFYYCMLIAFLLFESFKQDVSKDVIPVRT